MKTSGQQNGICMLINTLGIVQRKLSLKPSTELSITGYVFCLRAVRIEIVRQNKEDKDEREERYRCE
jgi:hypothetical protein